jgi:hypothetical protein
VLAQVLVADAQAIHDAGPEILDQHVRGATNRRSTSLPPSDFRLTVTDFLPLFCARNEAPISRWLSDASAPSCRAEIAVFRNFDLDDFRAEERELIGAERAREHIAQIEHTDPASA